MDEAIFEFAYRMALDDATGQQSYKGRGKGSKTKLRECDEAKRAVKEYIDAIVNGDSRANVEEAISDVEEAFKKYLTEEEDGEFTFGNAQKLVNMTAKYMFMTTYGRPELRERFESCHCPMDSIMVDIVIKQVKIRKNIAEELGLERGWVSNLRHPWSKITGETREQYDLFQKLVSSLCSCENPRISPIEFDFKNWQ